jgi:acyl-CoA thioesterase I
MPKSLFATCLILLLGAFALIWNQTTNQPRPAITSPNIKYIPLGDSYTIGLGVEESDRWPNVLTKNLRKAGANIELIANPAVSGYEVTNAIQRELPIVEKIKPDLVTVLIGANDNFRENPSSLYQQSLKELLNKLQPLVSNPKSIVLITIPDYSKSPAANTYSADEKERVSKSIEEYNKIIKDEAQSRGLKVVDIFPLSQTMTQKVDYIYDGLHPSTQGYAKWEKIIYPVVLNLLKE